MKTGKSLSIVVLASSIFGACSLNYRDAQILEEIEETVPNIRMEGISHTVATKDRILMKITAERSESYEKTKKVVLFGVRFQEYDSRGEFVAEGRADRVVYYTDTKNAEIVGGIDLHSHKEKGGIKAAYLFWNDEQRILKGGENTPIELTDEDGSRFSGRGFEADLKRMIISFLDAVEGDYVVSDRD